MEKKSVLWLVLGVPFLFLLFLGCQRPPVRIALMTKLEAGSNIGSSEVNAARLFFESHPNRGGQGVEIVPFDDGWDPEKARAAYRRMRDMGIDILITSHVSSCAIAIMDDVVRDGVFMLVTGAVTPLLSGRDDGIFRNVPDSLHEQDEISRWVASKKFGQTLVIRDTDNDAYTGPALERFLRGYRGAVRTIDISMASLDPNTLKKAIGERSFDLVYLLIGGYKIAAGSIAQMARLEVPACSILFTPWMKTPSLVDSAGSALSNAWMPSLYPKRGDDARVDSWFARFRDEFDYSPTFISLNVYQAMEMLGEAVHAGAVTPEGLTSYFRNRSFETSFGPVAFDAFGDTTRPFFFIGDIAGEFR